MSLPASIAHLFQPYVPESDQIPLALKSSMSNDWQMPGGMAALREAMGDDRCSLCGEPMDFECVADDKMRPTFEHVLPKGKDGKNHRNRLIAHRDCNAKKGNALPTGCELIRLQVVNARLYGDSPINRRPIFRVMDHRKAVHLFWFSQRKGVGARFSAEMVQAIAQYMPTLDEYHAATEGIERHCEWGNNISAQGRRADPLASATPKAFRTGI